MGKDLLVNENMYGYAEGRDEASQIIMEHILIEENGSGAPPHWHDQLLLMYIVKGEMTVLCRNQKVLGEQGDIIIVNPNEIHSVENAVKGVEYYLLKIDLILLLGKQPDLKQTIYAEPLLKNSILFENKVSRDDLTLNIIKNMVKEFREKNEGHELALIGLTYQMLTTLLRKYKKTIPDKTELDMQYRRLNQIKPAIIYMEDHFAEKVTLADLSEIAHLSPIHFSRVFKTVSGFSPMDFLNQLRVQKAAQLLVKTDKTIVEIAMDTGFNDGNYFSRFFKKCRNETPSEFREKYLK